MEPGQLWLGDGEASAEPPRPRGWRRTATALAAGACLALVGVPLGLVLSQGGAPQALGHHKTPAPRGGGPAEQEVISALSATTDAGSFSFSYVLSATGPTATGRTGRGAGGRICRSGGGSSGPDGAARSTINQVDTPVTGCATTTTVTGPRTIVSGTGTLDTNPLRMVVSSSFGYAARIDGTTIWIGGGAGLVATDTAAAGAGSPLVGFASEIESALGNRGGGVGVLSASSPTGYLDLAQTEVTGAEETGTSTLGGTAVTDYDVTLDPTTLTTSAAGTTPEEVQAIQGALGLLKQEGLTALTAHLAIDDAGYIRQATTTATFSDGGSVSLKTTLSNIGCAGDVLMPGQQGSATPPAGCSSPDTGVAPVATDPTTTAAAGSTTTSALSTPKGT